MFAPRRLLFALCLAAAACAGGPKPIQLPSGGPALHYAPRNERDRTPPPTADRAPIAFDVQLYGVLAPPDGTAIANAAAAIMRTRGAPFRGRSRLPIGTRWLSSTDVDNWLAQRDELTPETLQVLGEARAVLAPAFALQLDAPDAPLPRMLLSHAANGTAVTLVTPASDGRSEERLDVAEPIVAQASAGLFVPATELRSTRGGYLLLLRAADAPDAQEVEDAAAAAAAAGSGEQPPEHLPRQWQVAMRAVGERNRRPALLALCAGHDLDRVVDLLLTCDEPALIAITAALQPIDADAEDVAWQIERAAWRAVLPRIEREELSPPMFAATLRHLGAVADDPATLELLLQTQTTSPAFGEALLDENVAALADRSTAVRVAAHIWLDLRDVEVEGYDPMADRAQRRRALRRFLNARSQEQRG